MLRLKFNQILQHLNGVFKFRLLNQGSRFQEQSLRVLVVNLESFVTQFDTLLILLSLEVHDRQVSQVDIANLI